MTKKKLSFIKEVEREFEEKCHIGVHTGGFLIFPANGFEGGALSERRIKLFYCTKFHKLLKELEMEGFELQTKDESKIASEIGIKDYDAGFRLGYNQAVKEFNKKLKALRGDNE